MKFPITISISAGAVAWYAAIISSGLLLIEALRYWKERINVVLECNPGYRVHGGGSMYQPDKDYIVITVINKGKRPVTISKVGYISKKGKGKHGILTDSFFRGSRELTEGKSTDYLIEQDLLDLSKIKYFVAYDLTGREYRGKLKSK